ncbi:hypothetical protein K3495_g4296 [Podosphaera aphanis]|nr:hypothetical protein K3495_g4296 [Podosphaera aphanis]
MATIARSARADEDIETQKTSTPPLSSENKSDKPLDKHRTHENGILSRMQRGEAWLDEKMGIETQGADRIHEEDKCPPSDLNIFLIWWSLSCHVGSLPIGILGPEFGLSLRQSIIAIVTGTLLGSVCPAFCGTLGPKLGLRSIATARYSFGFYGAKICSLLNVVIGIGFATVNIVVVGQILSAVSDYQISLAVGCIIISVISYMVSIFGFKLIHSFEKYAWIASFIVLCVLLGQIWSKIDSSAPPTSTGLTNTGTFLSFLAINFSSASAWSSIAADYLCNYPADMSAWKVSLYTFCGIVSPTIFSITIGACVGNIALNKSSVPGAEITTYVYPVLAEAYQKHGLGGILREAPHPLGFSKFMLIIHVFSVIGNNVAVNYSAGLSIQLLSHFFRIIPRLVWSFLVALVVAVLAIAGRESLSIIVSNFVSMLGYWAISFTIILAAEDKLFRRTYGYDLDAWDVTSKLPWGAAAVAALLISYFAGGIPGMAQTWYIGPIAKKIGDEGGDVGVFLSGALTLIIYVPARWYERKICGR